VKAAVTEVEEDVDCVGIVVIIMDFLAIRMCIGIVMGVNA